MDAKDVRIFCEMAFKGLDYDSFTDRRVSPLAIGRKLGLDEKTVRVRVNKMEEEGFVKYYQAMPSLAVFNLNIINSYRFEALNIVTKHRVIEALPEVPYIVEAIDYLGQVISVSIAGASSEQIEDVTAKLANRFELSRIILGKRLLKESTVIPDKLDWQIIQKLRYDALSSLKDLSESLSLTPRMVDYRISKLLDSGALLIRAIINTQKQHGLIFYELEMLIDESKQFEVVKKLSEMHGEKLWSVRSSATVGVLLANFFGFTLAEPEDTAVNALGLEGVKSCSLFIFKEAIEPQRPNWMDNLIEQKIVSFKSSEFGKPKNMV
ncbi:MAG TPA: winged helix-turn-helix transcriptional regulator [Nitrososphaera sp.]|jgi:DNA-binding Lrp family transcriptional regulator|nr:winged helix-turn-helix transcriptional regulator [Nitrososphaera sp.]